MYSVHGNIRAAIIFIAVSAFPFNIAFPQTARFEGRAGDPLRLMLAGNPCARNAGRTPAALLADATAAGGASSPCDVPPAAIPAVKPCDGTSQARTGCDGPSDPVQAHLDAMGKPGQKITRAREKVLAILQSENACSAWFQKKDSNLAATFRTLSYALDRHGDEFVLESTDISAMNIFQSPYVAKVLQADGPYSTVTLNTKGAFFSGSARVLVVYREGGPSSFNGTRALRVGPYEGETPPAQVLTLLHEFGHVLDLLPTDGNNVDGKSVQNTKEVLGVCRAELDSLARRSALSATP
jgi:hypothetical protein